LSTFNGGNGGTCVEVAVVPGSKEGSDQVIALRDGKNPDGPALIFTPDEWRAFTVGVQDGEYPVAVAGHRSIHPSPSTFWKVVGAAACVTRCAVPS
jgi:Domain of unknown function (DUF397)